VPAAVLELPAGRTTDGLRCFDLEQYKVIATIYARYVTCEAQKPLVAELVEATEDKQAALRAFAGDLELTLTRAEAERSAYELAATTSAEQAATEAQRKRVWRAVAVASLAAALVLGAVATGIGGGEMTRKIIDSPLVREDERRRDRLEAVCALCLLIVVALLLAVRAVGADPVDAPKGPDPQAVIGVDRAILHLMTPDPYARIVTDDAYRDEVEIALVVAGEARSVPPLLLTMLAFRESTFDSTAIGAAGELGLFQVMPRWRHVLGCDLDTVGGQADCTARMLASYYGTCKTWQGALTLYATGKGCATGPATTRRIASRIAQWKQLEALVGAERVGP
jgi:hypothetical protein